MPANPLAADRDFGLKLVTAIASGFALLVMLLLVGAWSLYVTQLQGRRVAHTHVVETQLYQVNAAVERVATAGRGYLLSLDERYATRLEEIAAQTDVLLVELSEDTADNPAQQARIEELRTLVQTQLGRARDAIEALRADPGLDPRAVFAANDGAAPVVAIRELAERTIAEERALLASRSAAEDRSQTIAYAVLALAALLLFAIAGGTIHVVRTNMGELRRSRRVLEGMNELLEGAVAVRTADLSRANAEIQRFAYIVSHDLRSPLVNVMGFTAELEAASGELRSLVERAEEKAPDILTPEARLAAREDLPEAIGFIRSSTQKMDRLINAILRLSREGRRVVTPEPLDMDALIGGIVDSLRHRLGESDSDVTVETPLPGIVSDRVGIEQIFSNLIENALKYSKPGKPVAITVRGRRSGARIVFEVEDDGRGIDPKDHERIFDLFRRSGLQDRTGEGIGLAHVRAMAYRLGGSVACESALDEGATFRLSIPETIAGDKEG